MPFLTVNAIELGDSIAEPAGVKEGRREIGETSAAYNGTLRKSRQSIKNDLEFETVPMLSATALAWESLIRGLGEHWSFDSDLYGSKGLGPTAGYDASRTTSGPKFGAGELSVTGVTGTISFAAALGSNWTACVWRYESAAWHHYVITSAGTKWYDGVSDDAHSTIWFEVASGTATISNTAGAAVLYDDLVLLPFLPVSTWPTVWGVATSAFSALPKLTIAGDAVPEATTRTVMGEATPSFRKVMLSGSLRTNAKTLSVALSEV